MTDASGLELLTSRREVALESTWWYAPTSEPRTATVLSIGDTTVLELDADVFRRLGAADPRTLEEIGMAAVARRLELDQARDSLKRAGSIEPPATLLGRMKKFLGIG